MSPKRIGAILVMVSTVTVVAGCGMVSTELNSWKTYLSDVILGFPESQVADPEDAPVQVEQEVLEDLGPIKVPQGIY